MIFSDLKIGDKFVFVSYWDRPGEERQIFQKTGAMHFLQAEWIGPMQGTSHPLPMFGSDFEVYLIHSPHTTAGYWDAGDDLCGFCVRLGSWWLYGKARMSTVVFQELKARPSCGDDVDFTDQTSMEMTFLAKPHDDLPLVLLETFAPEFLHRVYGVLQMSFKQREVRYAEFDGDGKFVCPLCRGSHDRGPIDGMCMFRCLRCGQVFPVDPCVKDAENSAAVE